MAAVCPKCNQAAPEGASVCPADGTALGAPGLVGEILGERYRVTGVLGEGGMGTVYLAQHVVLGKRFAVKVLRQELSQREDLVRRFQQEAIAASQIGQENIVSVVDFGRTAAGRLYYAMEALQGPCLTDVLRRERRVPVERALPILAQIARALGAAHARGIVHRDVKPDNVVLVPREEGPELVKVLDFGISMVTGDLARGGRITSAGAIIGTPEYMSPEQADGEEIDQRADIYAWGVLAYEVLTGTLPFPSKSVVDLLIAHRQQDPEPPSKRCPEALIPSEVEALVLQALAKRREERPASMSEVARELSRLSAPLKGHPTPVAPAPVAASAFSSTARTLPEASVPRRSRSPFVLGAGALALALGVSAGWAVFKSGVRQAASLEALSVLPATASHDPDLVAPPPLAEDKKRAAQAADARRKVRLVSEPPGASVVRDGKPLGPTPLEVEIPKDRPQTFFFDLDGHLQARRRVSATVRGGSFKVVLKKKTPDGPAKDQDETADDAINLKDDPYPGGAR